MPVPDSTRRIPRASARAAVLEQLQRWIQHGVLEPGEVVKDSDIAERLGVSRTPVREALQILEQQGLIESVPGRYTRVTRASVEDAELVYPPLSVLEALAAGIATDNVSAADLAAMRAHNGRLIKAAERGDAKGARDADTAFHEVLVSRAKNQYLAGAVEQLRIHLSRLEILFFSDIAPARASHEQHVEIVDALERRDAAAAAELTRQNFLRFRQQQR